jgi:sterol desaturase/sphingolipid hydroxylase (fatty acid hydroxylase superfamily)
MGGAASTTASFRAEYRTTKIGRSYSGWGHFAFTNVGSLTVIGFSISRVDHPSWKELLVIPIAFLIANLVEYLGHRGPMHRMKRGLGVIFRRHTLEHHHFFTDQQMSYESSRDFKAVLFPPVMLLFFIGGIATPIGLVLFLLISPNAGWLFVAVGISYYLTYEWLHFAYHLPEDSAVGRLAVLGVLRRHHQTHHNLQLMGRWNFNITFPICDRVFGTSYPRGGQRR